MELSSALLKEFARSTMDNKGNEAMYAYGRVVTQDNSTYVRLDGSEILTPVSMAMDAVEGDRVIVMVKNHVATITGNISAPASARKATDLEAAVNEVTGRPSVFHQTTAPSAINRVVGDTWFDSSNDYKMYRWSGTEWTEELFGADAIADRSVSSVKIDDLAVTNAKIADGTIQNAKIASLDAGKINTGILSADRIGARAIKAEKIDIDDLFANNIEVTNVLRSTDYARTGNTFADAGMGIDFGRKVIATPDFLVKNGRVYAQGGEIAGFHFTKPVSNVFTATPTSYTDLNSNVCDISEWLSDENVLTVEQRGDAVYSLEKTYTDQSGEICDLSAVLVTVVSGGNEPGEDEKSLQGRIIYRGSDFLHSEFDWIAGYGTSSEKHGSLCYSESMSSQGYRILIDREWFAKANEIRLIIHLLEGDTVKVEKSFSTISALYGEGIDLTPDGHITTNYLTARKTTKLGQWTVDWDSMTCESSFSNAGNVRVPIKAIFRAGGDYMGDAISPGFEFQHRQTDTGDDYGTVIHPNTSMAFRLDLGGGGRDTDSEGNTLSAFSWAKLGMITHSYNQSNYFQYDYSLLTEGYDALINNQAYIRFGQRRTDGTVNNPPSGTPEIAIVASKVNLKGNQILLNAPTTISGATTIADNLDVTGTVAVGGIITATEKIITGASKGVEFASPSGTHTFNIRGVGSGESAHSIGFLIDDSDSHTLATVDTLNKVLDFSNGKLTLGGIRIPQIQYGSATCSGVSSTPATFSVTFSEVFDGPPNVSLTPVRNSALKVYSKMRTRSANGFSADVWCESTTAVDIDVYWTAIR